MRGKTPVTIVNAMLVSLLLSSCATYGLLDKANEGTFLQATITHLETVALTKEGSLIVCFLGAKPDNDGDSLYHLTLPLKSYRASAALRPGVRDLSLFKHRHFGTTIALPAEDMFKPECPIQPMPKGMRPLPVLGAPPFWPISTINPPRIPVPDNYTDVLYAHSTKLDNGRVANLTYAAQEGFVEKYRGDEPMNYLIFMFYGKELNRNSYLKVLVPLTVAVDVVTLPVQIVIWVIAVASGGH